MSVNFYNSINTYGFIPAGQEIDHNISITPNVPEEVPECYTSEQGTSYEAWNWIEAHEPILREAIQEVVDHTQYISYVEFLDALGTAIDSVLKQCSPDFQPNQNAVVMVEGRKSNKWVAEIALTSKAFQANKYFRLGTKEAISFKEYVTSLNPGEKKDLIGELRGKTVFLFDDASYSGKQMTDHIHGMHQIFQYHRLPVKELAVVVPFMTDQAERSIMNEAAQSKIPTIVADHQRLPSLSNISQRSYEQIVQAWYGGSRVASDQIGLGWFQHKVPNDQSFPAALVNGSVYNSRGVSQRGGKFTLVPKIIEVYKSVSSATGTATNTQRPFSRRSHA